MKILTEHKRNGVIFRGHPEYRGMHWRDWVLVDWGGEDSKFPAEIWGFVILQGLPKESRRSASDKLLLHHGDIDLEDGHYAVIESAFFTETQAITFDRHGNQEPQSNIREMKSTLFEPIEKELASSQMTSDRGRRRKFYLADVEAFIDPLMVIPNVGNRKGLQYLQIKPRSQWVRVFEEWLDKEDPTACTNNKQGNF